MFLIFIVLTAISAKLGFAQASRLRQESTTYHVSSSKGNDAWPGTQSQPWKTLEKVSSKTFRPGDKILLRRGDLWVGQALTLEGHGDHRGAWITVGAYGTGTRPHILNPPYHADQGLVDWRSINKVFPENPRHQIKVALLIKGSNWQVRGLEISHAEMGILTKGSMGYLFEDLFIHNIGFNDNGEPLKEHEGGHLLYPKYPRYEEIERETGAFPMWGDPSYPDPEWGNAIEVGGEKVTIRNVVIEKATGGIHGWGAEIRIYNVFLDKITTGGLTIGGADLKISHATVLNALWPGNRFGWFGVCVLMASGDSSQEVTRSEIAYTGSADGGGDCCALEVDQGNSGVLWTRNFLHHNCGAAVEFGMAGPNQHIDVIDNVTYANGHLHGPHGYAPEFSGDASPYGARKVRIEGNRIYRAIPGQYLNYYFGLYNPENPAQGYSNDWDYPIKNADYRVQNNTVHEPTTYESPRAIPETAPEKQNVTPLANVHVSSGLETARFAKDNDFETEWRSQEEKPWIRFEWDRPQTIDEIWISDRRDLENWGVSGRIALSDGWTTDVTGGILNNGAPRKILLDKPRTITWLRYQVTRTVPESPGTNVGLAELQAFKPSALSESRSFVSPAWKIDFEDRPDRPTLLRGNQYNVDWKNTDWTTRIDPRTRNRYLYIDFPRNSGGIPTWAIRYIALPWDSTVKSVKIACPEGTVVSMGQIGQEQGIFFPCTSELTEHETGWTVANATSNLIGFWMDVTNALHKETPADLNDIWLDDFVLISKGSKANSKIP